VHLQLHFLGEQSELKPAPWIWCSVRTSGNKNLVR